MSFQKQFDVQEFTRDVNDPTYNYTLYLAEMLVRVRGLPRTVANVRKASELTDGYYGLSAVKLLELLKELVRVPMRQLLEACGDMTLFVFVFGRIEELPADDPLLPQLAITRRIRNP